MANIKIKTKNQLEIHKKPRVYFTCHPEDFRYYFRKVCDDLFATHDCAIYYTEDMTQVIAPEDRDTDLGRNNLFVVPVTLKLLNTPNRAMDVDIPYALQQHIPVLPIMMELGIDDFYSQPDKFGELQYLSPFSNDRTEISYKEKLKKYLESILLSDELTNQIRSAFKGYIFLSYRKKDRRYANELMRLIHSIPQCRDIAIWFDEFLTPGESFRESIDRILHDSKLFALLVTPSLLDEGNFVMTQEYPAAKRSGIPLLPIEMVTTDRGILSEKFPNIPKVITPREESFHRQFLDTVPQLATEANNTPEHNYLIGIAYLEGIDVEVNREYALELITAAAEAGLPEAMLKLRIMYEKGIGVTLDYRKAVIWAEKYALYMADTYGLEHTDTLASLNNLATHYDYVGNVKKALELEQKVYELLGKVLGEEHPDTLTALNNLALYFNNTGNFEKALEMNKTVYALRSKVLGEEHPDTLTALSNLAGCFNNIGNYEKALEASKTVYELRGKVLGDAHPDTLIALNNLACIYQQLGEHKTAIALHTKGYTLNRRSLGEEHPVTLKFLGNLAAAYENVNDLKRTLELEKKVYELRSKVLGEEHPDTLTALNNLTCTYIQMGEYQAAVTSCTKIYTIYSRILNDGHPDTLVVLENLAFIYTCTDDLDKALEMNEKLYDLRCKILGSEHPDTRKVQEEINKLNSAKNNQGRRGFAKFLSRIFPKYRKSSKR